MRAGRGANPAGRLGIAGDVLSNDQKEREQFIEVGRNFEAVIKTIKPASQRSMRAALWIVALNYGVLNDEC